MEGKRYTCSTCSLLTPASPISRWSGVFCRSSSRSTLHIVKCGSWCLPPVKTRAMVSKNISMKPTSSAVGKGHWLATVMSPVAIWWTPFELLSMRSLLFVS